MWFEIGGTCSQWPYKASMSESCDLKSPFVQRIRTSDQAEIEHEDISPMILRQSELFEVAVFAFSFIIDLYLIFLCGELLVRC